MPEHAEHEAALRVLDRLDRPVALRVGGDAQAVPETGHALVVVAARLDARRARRLCGEALRLDLDLMSSEGPVRPAVDVVGQAVGQVLLELAAVGDVDDLHAAADAQAGEVALGRAADEQQLERVAVGRRRLARGVGLGAVGAGVEVRAAGDEHAVEQVEQRLRVVEVGGRGGDQQRAPAGPRHRAHVGERHHGRELGPEAAVAHLLHVAGHADVRDHGAEYRWRSASTRAADSRIRSRRPGERRAAATRWSSTGR